MNAGLRLRLRAAAIMLAGQSAAALASTLIMTKGFRFSPAFEIARDWFAIAALSSVLAGLFFGNWLRRRSSATCCLAALTGLACLLVAIVLAWEAAAAIESAMGSPANAAGFAQRDFVLDAINMKAPGDLLSALEATVFLTLGLAGILSLFVPHIAALVAGVAAWRQAGRDHAPHPARPCAPPPGPAACRRDEPGPDHLPCRPPASTSLAYGPQTRGSCRETDRH